MRLGIFSLGSKSSLWTYEEAKKYFDEVYHFNLRRIDIKITANDGIVLIYDGKKLPELDCAYIKGSFKYRMFTKAIAEYYQNKAYLPIKPESIDLAHNKLYTHLALSHSRVPMPTTYVVPNIMTAKKVLKKASYPIIIKIPTGTQGKGVMYADSFASASSTVDTLESLKQPFLIQEYVETKGCDTRVIVAGDHYIASMKRIAATGEQRSNLHAGGQSIAYEASEHLKQIAFKVAKALKADIVGVDILEGNSGAKVIEANISPGLQGISNITKKNIADEIAKNLASKTKEFLSVKKINQDKDVENMLNTSNKSLHSGIVLNLDFRGGKILLPDYITKISNFKEDEELMMYAKKGEIFITRNY